MDDPNPTHFDWLYAALGCALVSATYLDGWAHSHHKVESFFTPWHAGIYGALMAILCLIAATVVRRRRPSQPWRDALPDGYAAAGLGAVLFAVGGVLDMTWHTLLGIETSVEAGLSPPHLLLAVASGLMLSGPLMAAWRRPDSGAPSLRQLLPALLAAMCLLSLFTYMAQFAHPFVANWAAPLPPAGVVPAAPGDVRGALLGEYATLARPGLWVSAILVDATVSTALVLLLVVRWALPFGALTLIFTLNGLLLATQRGHYHWVLVAGLAGLIADALMVRLKPAPRRPTALRRFAVACPAVYVGLTCLTLVALGEMSWRPHLWLGATVLAGLAGLVLSYLVVPPPIPTGPVSTD